MDFHGTIPENAKDLLMCIKRVGTFIRGKLDEKNEAVKFDDVNMLPQRTLSQTQEQFIDP